MKKDSLYESLDRLMAQTAAHGGIDPTGEIFDLLDELIGRVIKLESYFIPPTSPTWPETSVIKINPEEAPHD